MRGGAETQVYLLAKELHKRGHEVQVISMRDAEAYEEELLEEGIRFRSLGMTRGVPDPRGLFRLVGALRRFCPDVLHSHMIHANLLGRIAQLLSRVPVQVSTAHSVYEGGGWRNIAYRLTDSLATTTTNVCQAGVDRFVEVGATPRHKIRLVVNGLNVSDFARDSSTRARLRETMLKDSKAFIWLAVGSLEFVKDYPLMLRAFKTVRAAFPSAVLWIVSGGPDADSLKELSRSLGFSERQVRFLGVRSDIQELMSAADAFVLTSRWEGLPMVLLEASCAELPIVSTSVGGVPEAVIDGRTGLLTETGDVQGVAEAMSKVMAASDTERAVMGAAARDHVHENFRIERVVDDWVELYRRLLSARSVSKRRKPTGIRNAS